MCIFYKYLVLYEGPAEVGRVNQDGESQIMFSVQTKKITFPLVQEKEHRKCGFAFIQTEHPELFILEGAKGSFFTSLRKLNTSERKLITFIEIRSYIDVC